MDLERDYSERERGQADSVVDEKPKTEDSATTKSASARGPASPKWEKAARKRLREKAKSFEGPIEDLLKRDANEGDTRLLVTDYLCEALGYDKYTELTTEYRVRGQYADFGVRIDRELVAFIEVKRIATKLNVRHLNQVQTYALNEGVEWIILTNGAQWQAYHVTASMPIQLDLAFDIDLTHGVTRKEVDHLFYLCRESLQRRQIDELWQARRATAPDALLDVLFSDRVLKAMRLELRTQTSHRTEEDELERLFRKTIVRPELLDIK